MTPFSRLLQRNDALSRGPALPGPASDLLGVVEPEGTLRPLNVAWRRALGHALEELDGLSFLDLAHPEDREALAAAWEEARGGALDVPRVCARIRRADGAWVRLDWTLAPGAGREDVLVAGRDLAELSTLREAVRALQPLAQAGRLALGLIHDVNRLLNMISGCAALLKTELRAEGQTARDLEVIQDTALMGGELAQGLADALHSGPATAWTELNVAVLRAQRLLARMLSGPRLIVELDPNAGWVPLGAPQITQILLNLVVNASDAMGGGGCIVIATQRVSEGVVLSVSDSGPGMAPAIQKRLFEPFFTTKPAGQGTGLGLTAVRDFATSCGGSVTVRSRLGSGTTVLVRLPSPPRAS